jgi:hypothetical protein
MKTNFNYENSTEVSECSICGYKHKKYYRKHTYEEQQNDISSGFGDEEFLTGETEFLYSEKVDYAPDRLVKKIIYACPKCGVLQIEV